MPRRSCGSATRAGQHRRTARVGKVRYVTDAVGGETRTSRVSRRAEYAEETRRAVIEEARRLFNLKGYFATKVDDIATAARVSPATVYVIGESRGCCAS
jgi:hypothetical protein